MIFPQRGQKILALIKSYGYSVFENFCFTIIWMSEASQTSLANISRSLFLLLMFFFDLIDEAPVSKKS